jgi:Dockerin type I domain/Fibronectin type III domain/Putative Ig domain
VRTDKVEQEHGFAIRLPEVFVREGAPGGAGWCRRTFFAAAGLAQKVRIMANLITADAPPACSWHSCAIRRAAVVAMATLMLLAAAAHAQTLTVYDDALQNGFADYSYGGGTNFSNAAFAHTGATSVSILGHNYNALSFYHAPAASLHTANFPILRFWVNGGTAAGQQFYLGLQSNNVAVGTAAPLDTYIAGGGIGLGVWREVTIDLRQAPFNAVDFDRIDIQSTEDATHTDASATFFDDIVLGQPTVALVSAMQIEHDVTVSSMVSDRFTWQDSLGHPRVASLAHMIAPTAAPVSGSRGGALYEYRYQLTNGATRVADITTCGGCNAAYGGFGYVVSHSHYYGSYPCVTNDDSPLGYVFGGTWQRVFEGRHHAIFRFTQSYPRNCDGTNTPVQRFVPVTIDWVFSTGRDNPLWAVTYDVDLIAAPGHQPAPANTYFDDSRAPYGELNIDGDGSTDLNGVAWGDFYKFTTTNAAGTGVTQGSPWNWTVTNTVPYVQTWLDGPLSGTSTLDAAMGIVQTQTIAQQDAGGARDQSIGSDITPEWQHTSATAATNFFPNGDGWPYQTIGDNVGCNCGLNDARMTWKTQWGFIGQSTYLINNGAVGASAATAPGYPKKSYSTYVVLGQRTAAPVEAQVTQVETIQLLTLTASTGSVVTSGPAGITRADNVTYSPAGYNHVYGALAFNAAGNALDANIAVGAGTLKKPLIIVGNYTGGDPVVKVGGVTLAADADYFASVLASANELWITLNRDLNGATNRLEITGGAPATAPTITSAAPPGGTFGTAYNYTVTATGSPTISFTFTAGALPTGVSLTSATGVLSGTPSAVGTFTGTITASNGTAPDASQSFSIAIAKANQTINFANPGAQTFSTSVLTLSASATSGLTVTFASTTLSVCTVSGVSLTMLTAGTCTITADQGGNASFNAAPTVTQSFAINATAPGAPAIGTATAGNGQATISFTPPSSNGGSPITGYSVTCTPGPVSASGAASPITVAGLTNGTAYTCSVTALNVVGAGPASSTVSVTPTGTLAGDANGDGQVTVGDVFYLINYLFAGGPAPKGSGDANGDGQVTVADVFYLINYLFAGGPAPR